MQKPRMTSLLAAVAILIAASCAHALGESDKGVYVEDFESGMLPLDWDCEGDAARIERRDAADRKDRGNTVLHVVRAAEVQIGEAAFDTFSFSVDVQGHGGVRFRGRYRAVLSSGFGGSLRITDGTRTELARRKLASRTADLKAADTRRLKIVCAGPLVRVYVDGRVESEKTDARVSKAPLALVAADGGARFDNLKISRTVSPEEAAVAALDVPAGALVFPAGKEVELLFHSANLSGSDVRLCGAVRSFRGLPVEKVLREDEEADDTLTVAYGVKQFYRIEPSGDKAVASGDAVVKAGASGKTQLNFGAIPAGFYLLELAWSGDAGRWGNRTYPLAVLTGSRPERYAAPPFPVGVYSGLMQYRRTMEPLWWKTYVHAVAHDLRRRNLNAMVACGGFDEGEVEILNIHGVAGISRGNAWLDHPGVIGSLMSDEPHPGQEVEELKQQYQDLRKATDKIITTCLVGESMGLGGPGDPVNMWKELQPKARVFRWYGVKKHFYGPLHPLHYKGVLPLASVARIAEASSETPWWAIFPTFGGSEHEAYFQNPSPAQVKGMMHLACAHGANGLLLYLHQGGLIDAVNLKPLDGKLDAATEVASLIARHAPLLLSLRYGGFEVRNSNPIYVEAVPRRTEEGRAYIYVVNKDCEAAAAAVLAFKAGERASVQDVFSGKPVKLAPGADGLRAVELTLGPGDAALVDLDTVVPEPPAIQPLRGKPSLDGTLLATAQTAVEQHGVAVLRVKMPEDPCIPGDAIGLSRADDPRRVWEEAEVGTRCFCWSGRLHPRTAEGYLPLSSALRVAQAGGGKAPYWTLYPAVARNGPTAGELRAMLHLALAYGSKAVLVPDGLKAELVQVVDEVGQLAAQHGKVLASLQHGGLDVRCKNARVAALPRHGAVGNNQGAICVYAVNLQTAGPVTAELLLWDNVWTWTTARDLFGGQDLAVKPRNEEGYLSCTVTLRPGEGRLIVTNATTRKK